ncbi:hypothetical protein PR048_017812 [Dryococelus australis]|uniref:Uncharacterized protein n=1 Tax=Dryococelus australis TaxID=614101 RepID=A0ABQ9HAU4_9NEOP|nr:hypothetical protein PR048_017812 [Dryococelus australis]
MGFGSPRLDMCSLWGRISSAEDKTEQVKLTTEMRIHISQAKSFFERLHEQDPYKLTLYFDHEP